MWQSGTEGLTRGYRFTYDGMNRMQEAVYGEDASLKTNTDRFSEKVTGYDRNGNILGLQRYGKTAANGYGLIDNLTFTLTENQLTRVDDASSAIASGDNFEFTDAVKQQNEYAYDGNDNLTKDLNKKISEIQYNSLNFPRQIVFGNSDSIVYVYAADGSKFRATATLGGVTTTTDYCSNVIYENGVQKLLLTEAGYVTLDNGKHHYYLLDHRCNNRVSVDKKGAVEEVNHYYPFGGIFASTCSVQPYKYNGKELESTLLWYDYGTRRYDAVLGRFTTVDPLAEKFYPWSPYAYCYSNPVKHIDPTGKFGETFWDVFNVIIGLKSFKSNLEAGNYSEAFSDGIGIIMDAGSVLVPGVPGGAATAIKSVRNSDKYFDILQAMRRGRINETKVLENIGEKKNTQIFQTKIQNNKTKK